MEKFIRLGRDTGVLACGTITLILEICMRKFLIVVSLMIFAANFLYGQDFGVLAKEHIVNMPQDQGKWHISVISDKGDNRILDWFDSNSKMKTLKNSVQFHPVTTDSLIYKERYATNGGDAKITALPCVRLQNADGVIAYQACGSQIPMTAEGLYAAISEAVKCAGDRKEILPWRRNHSNPTPKPEPEPEPILPPVPPVSPPDITPVIEPANSSSTLIGIAACVGGLVVGIGIGQWKKLQERIAAKAKKS
jgi:hypothetical protein